MKKKATKNKTLIAPQKLYKRTKHLPLIKQSVLSFFFNFINHNEYFSIKNDSFKAMNKILNLLTKTFKNNANSY